MKIHNLKSWPEFFEAVRTGVKRFELRKDDRGYEVGDTLTLEEYRPGVGAYTGRKLARIITYIARGEKGEMFGLREGYAVLGIHPTPFPKENCDGQETTRQEA